jgi:GNAT superfamily N-acetyltransferase
MSDPPHTNPPPPGVTLEEVLLTSSQHERERIRLRDGREVLIGPLRPADARLLAEAFERLSEESRRLRFLGPKTSLSRSDLRYLTDVDGHDHVALAATDPLSGRGVAIGRFVRDPRDPERAEVALTVADDWQRRGLGKLLLSRLTERAREEGVKRFIALVSTDNRNMQNLLRRGESPASVHQVTAGVTEWEIELAPRGLGQQLEEALRAMAAGHLQLPPRLCDALRTLVPLQLLRR